MEGPYPRGYKPARPPHHAFWQQCQCILVITGKEIAQQEHDTALLVGIVEKRRVSAILVLSFLA